ncbi:MAG: Ada metal-binding domain-containing protein [Gemmatimonadales bacterium]|nr:Ada metal-binding domain-containing protein [Gemmatimonadales bacterium]
MQRYRLLAADGSFRDSVVPGQLAGNRRSRIYGRLDCPSAIRVLQKGYAKWRVFFADEAAAVAVWYRPCGRCLPIEYRAWKLTCSDPRRG